MSILVYLGIMKAILWDGHKQLHGELILSKKRIRFELSDFKDTDLDFNLGYKEIKQITYETIFDTSKLAIRITSNLEKSNVFVVEEPRDVVEIVQNKCQKLINKNSEL